MVGKKRSHGRIFLRGYSCFGRDEYAVQSLPSVFVFLIILSFEFKYTCVLFLFTSLA